MPRVPGRVFTEEGALLKNGALDVYLVPVPFPGRDLQVRDFSLGRLELGTTK